MTGVPLIDLAAAIVGLFVLIMFVAFVAVLIVGGAVEMFGEDRVWRL